jgi:hypothetical protein
MNQHSRTKEFLHFNAIQAQYKIKAYLLTYYVLRDAVLIILHFHGLGTLDCSG